MEIRGHLSCHDWGKIGKESLAGLFYWNSRKRNLIAENQPYSSVYITAILGCGTVIIKSNESLNLFITQQPQALGAKCAKRFNNKLPFEIKIFSIHKAMPLGCYPNKDQARKLHELYPNRYLDSNSKPKVIIALKYIEVLAGFRDKHEIFTFLSMVPELAIVVPYEKIEDYLYSGKESHLKEIFFYLVNATYLETKLSLDIFFRRIRTADNATKTALGYNMFEKLQEQCPYDSGVYAPLFLNQIILNPGQALFIPPGIVHTYTTGDCIEVSTCSTNLIRCGLSKKFKDSKAFQTVADFRTTPIPKLILEPTAVDIFSRMYSPPVQEFGVYRICVPEGHVYTLPVHESCSIITVTRGDAVLKDWRVIKFGTAMFVLPHEQINFTVRNDITIYSVFPNLNFEISDIN